MKEDKPKGLPNYVHLEERDDRFYRCEFCEKEKETYNNQKLPVCAEHKETMMLLLCPICDESLAVHWSAGDIVYWCIKHHGFIANDLKKDPRYHENGNLKGYWKKENIDKRIAEAEKLDNEFYGKPMTEQHKKEKEEYMKKKEIWIKKLAKKLVNR